MFKSTSQYTTGRGGGQRLFTVKPIHKGKGGDGGGGGRDVYCQGHRLIHKGEGVDAERERGRESHSNQRNK